MLASRVLPPIPRPLNPPPSVPPIATFFNIPRRYVRSNMQLGNNASSHSDMDDVKSTRSLRKTNRIHELRPASNTNPIQNIEEEQLPSPLSSSHRASKKRVASLHDEANGMNLTEIESPTDSRALSSAISTRSGELSGYICLCQPEPKIPRPRNAFILYRQHHQHDVVARNPRLANPEVSKIIGEQWKAEPDEQKKVWQDLAQEEKARHQEQFPDYRYQPRRLGKLGSLPFISSGEHTAIEKYRCSRCGGRSIRNPASPYHSTSNTPTLPPPNVSEGLTPTTRYLPMMSNLSLESPARRRTPGLSNLGNIQMPSSAREDTTMYSPLTPDSKRRRYNNYPVNNNNGRRSDTPYYSHGRRESLPPAQMRYAPPDTEIMPPPRTSQEARRSSVDLNLLVPGQHDQSRSVEAMVMSVPYNVKIKVLGRITPPLKDPGPTSPAIQIRGAIVAIEGDDITSIKELTDWLKHFLAKDKEYSPRIAEPPRAPSDDVNEASFEGYLDLIKEWHMKSKEMINYITTSHTPSPSATTSDDENISTNNEEDKPVSSPTPSIHTSTPIPVIILPTYQLHASDTYASKIPIQDVYSPMDHWQWMATLWRGTVGPDLTIYVRNHAKEEKNGGAVKPVEVNEDVRCLTVVKEKDGQFTEAALRRVGFEVGEWVRGLGGGKAI